MKTTRSPSIDGLGRVVVPKAIREQAGVLLESDGLYTRLSAIQNLDYFGRIARLSPSIKSLV